ncbi:MAG: YgfZ/GcvT domain-containing protein [Nodosilinea sp.]
MAKTPSGDSQVADGFPVSESDGSSAFDLDSTAWSAAKTRVALLDRSDCGVIELSGQDRLRFLHNQTTNAFEGRLPGEGCDTVFVTSTARTLDLVTVYVTTEALLIITSPGQEQRLIDWMDRYIFPADQVALANRTADTALLSLVGPQSHQLLAQVGIEIDPQAPDGWHHLMTLDQGTLRVAVGSGLALPGYTLLVPRAEAEGLRQRLTTAGAIPAGKNLWQQLRISQGRPAPGAELTEDYNPLESGLWQAISFDKGCYIGQETIARLNTYQGVKQQLWGLRLSAAVEPGTPIELDNVKIGLITSVATTPPGILALGYIRTRAGGAGLAVTAGGVEGNVVDLPFLSRGYLSP